jgi:hypothetical protein
MSPTQADGDRLWARLVAAADAAGDDREAFLARLVLLLANEVDDLDRVLHLVEEAQ